MALDWAFMRYMTAISRARNFARLLVRATGQRTPLPADQALHLARDPLGLLLLVVGLEALDPGAAALLGPQLLVLARAVARHDRVGGVEDQLGGAVVLLELDHGRLRPVALEVEDVAQVRATPRIDRLVVITDHAQVVMLHRERPDPQVLRAVRVLVLVDMQEAPALLVLGQHVLVLEEPHGLEQQVVEIERVGLAQAFAVAGRQPRDGALAMVRGVLGQERRIEHLVLGPADRAEDDGRPELAGQRHVLFAQDLLHQRLLVVRVVDDEPAPDPDGLPVRAQDPRRQRMERAGHHVPTAFTDEADDPFAQFRGGPVGERDGQDPPRGHVLDADEVRDAMGQHARLARPGTGQDQQRAVRRRDGTRLLGVEGAHDLVGASRDRSRANGRVLRGLGRGRVLRLDRRIPHPGRFVGDRRGRVGEVRERCSRRGFSGFRRGIEGHVAGTAAAGGAHPLIVGRVAYPAPTGADRRR